MSISKMSSHFFHCPTAGFWKVSWALLLQFCCHMTTYLFCKILHRKLLLIFNLLIMFCRGPEMRSLQCSLLLSRFRIWGFLEPLELTIYIIWLQMRYFTYFPFPYDLDIYIFLIHCSLFHLHSTHIFQLQIICCSFLSLILLLLYTW